MKGRQCGVFCKFLSIIVIFSVKASRNINKRKDAFHGKKTKEVNFEIECDFTKYNDKGFQIQRILRVTMPREVS